MTNAFTESKTTIYSYIIFEAPNKTALNDMIKQARKRTDGATLIGELITPNTDLSGVTGVYGAYMMMKDIPYNVEAPNTSYPKMLEKATHHLNGFINGKKV